MKAQIIPMIEASLGKFYLAKFNDKILNVTFASNFGQSVSLDSTIYPDLAKEKII